VTGIFTARLNNTGINKIEFAERVRLEHLPRWRPDTGRFQQRLCFLLCLYANLNTDWGSRVIRNFQFLRQNPEPAPLFRGNRKSLQKGYEKTGRHFMDASEFLMSSPGESGQQNNIMF